MIKQYVFEISAPTTANRVKSFEFIPDKNKGNTFRIKQIDIGLTNRDAIASTDAVGFQITTTKQDEETALLSITSEYEVFTKKLVNTFTQRDDPGDSIEDIGKSLTIKDPSKNMDIVLRSGKKYFFNSIITGQDGADVTTQVKLWAQYQNSDLAEEYSEAHSVEI